MTSKKNQGFGLLQALLVLAVGSIVIGIVSQKSASIAKSAKKTAQKNDILGFKSNIYGNVDCAATFSPSLGFGPKGSPCSSGYIDIRSKAGIILNSAGTSRFGKWNGLAYCTSGGIEIRFVSLLPSFYGNLADKQWVGKTAPENPSHYRSDELTAQPYSWAHPMLKVSQPNNPQGLCHDWFTTPSTNATCNGFTRKIDFKNKQATCESIPSCSYPDNLVFDTGSNKYVCNSSLMTYTYNQDKYTTDVSMSTVVQNFYNKADKILRDVEYNNSLISRFPDMSNYEDIYGNNFSQCAKVYQMLCPEGKAMWGYEALMEKSGKRCRTRCVQLKPY
ncbi:MAG: hypothetical protein WCI18_06165 [Pseudomonadota bacterium]